MDMSQKRQIYLRRELEILEYEYCQLRDGLKEEESDAQNVEKEKYEAEIAELKQKMKEEKAALEGDLCIAYNKMQKYTSSLKKQLFVFAEELLTIVSALRLHSDSASSSNVHGNKSENVRILTKFYLSLCLLL